MRPESHHSYAYHAPVQQKKQPKDPGKSRSCLPCSWRSLAAALALLLLLAAAVLAYLLVSLYSGPGSGYAYYHAGQTLYGPQCPRDDDAAKPTRLRPLPESFALGDPVNADLPPAQLVYTSFSLQSDSHVQLNLSVPPWAKLALYGRQTLKPTPTQHQFSHIVLGHKLHASLQTQAILLRSRGSSGLSAHFFLLFQLA